MAVAISSASYSSGGGGYSTGVFFRVCVFVMCCNHVEGTRQEYFSASACLSCVVTIGGRRCCASRGCVRDCCLLW